MVVQSSDPLLRDLLAEWLRRHPRIGTVVLIDDGAQDVTGTSTCAACRPDAVITEEGPSEDIRVVLDALASRPPAHAPPAAEAADVERAAVPLTGRELDVLRLLSLGRRSLEIGSVLGVSAHTVENHKRRIFAKLGARSETQAVAEAIRRGLVRRPPAVRTARLTPRESEIINLAAAGNSVKQTARALNISVKTVESIQSHLFRKLGVSGRTGAVAAVYGREETSNHSGP